MDNLTASTHTVNMVHAVNETIRRKVTVEFVEDDEFVRRNFQNDEGGKSEVSPLTSHPSPARQGTNGDRPSEGGRVYSQVSHKAKLRLRTAGTRGQRPCANG